MRKRQAPGGANSGLVHRLDVSVKGSRGMANVALGSVARQLESLFAGGLAAGLSDGQLLERFTARGEPADEAAFAAIVERHGPMVLGICRRVLGDHHHAEDAFQAVFLVLARQTRSIRDPELLGTWLFGVALRTARASRGRIARRRKTEDEGAVRQSTAGAVVAADQAMLKREQSEALHREIERLPGAFRVPVLLCYFEGLTLDEAAHRLRWPAGTLRSRLARAREKLRRGLTGRGFALSTTALAAALAPPRSASASISPLLCDTTTRAAIHFAAHHAVGGARSAPAASLAQEVLYTMLLHKLKLATLSLLLTATLAAAAGYHSLNAFASSREGEPPGEPRGNPARTEPRPPEDTPGHSAATKNQPRPAGGRMTVGGRVLDPQGKPLPNASVMIYGAHKQGGDIVRSGSSAPLSLGNANCDASGRFRLDMPRITSATHYMVGAAAVAPGYGVGWVDLDVDVDVPAAEITLRPEQVIEGRLFDINGQFAEGVRVSIEAMGHPQRGPEALPDGLEGGPYFWGGNYAKNLPAWPRPAIAGADGRFTIRGIGRDVRVSLMAEEPRFARQRIVVDTEGAAATKTVSAAMEPAKVIEGRITFADSGKPVPHAAISIWAYRGGHAFSSEYETDAEGNFRANPFSADRYAVSVAAPDGQPYLGAGTEIFAWTKGTSQRRVDLSLRKGVVLRGKVIEEGSGLPVDGAALGYVIRDGSAGVPACRVRTGPDGTYQFAVLPTAGTLAIMGPSDDYVFQELGDRMLDEGRPGGRRQYAHAFVSCDLKPGTESREVDVVLRRGTIVKARVTTPVGQPVANAWMFSRLLLQPAPWVTRQYWGEFHGDVRNGHCELHGLPPDAEIPVYFLDSKNQLGATAQFSVKAAAGGPISVRLEPCGLAVARLVDPNGKPLAGYRDPYLISMIVTPGQDWLGMGAAGNDHLSADADYLSRIDPDHYNNLVSNAEGRVTFPALIPGVTYRVNDNTAENEPGGRKTRKLLVAKPGQSIELGDIVIEKPDYD
jgi:RNA polymerase sigma factor (sigma-70 family)